jgi:hypothetical protein
MKKTMKTKHFIIAFFTLVLAVINANANNMLVQNVTTLNDNPTAKTVQVQFDLSWDNSWRDSINWDAAWIFLKFKDANGLWQHVKLNTNGFQNGSGTSNTVQVTSDNVGAWVYRDTRGSGTFNSTTMQLQWNYGLNGLSKVTGLEVRVFAVEMVYVPEGGFNCSNSYFQNSSYQEYKFSAPGDNLPVINTRLSPNFKTTDKDSIRIKGDAGIDRNSDGIVDDQNYPLGYKAFFTYKYEMSEQQYADFLNTLTQQQITTLGVEGTNIKISNNQYFSSTPNFPCSNTKNETFLAYADWSGLRPISFLEYNKLSWGPITPTKLVYGNYKNSCDYIIRSFKYIFNNYNCDVLYQYFNENYASQIYDVGTIPLISYYGVYDLMDKLFEPVISISSSNFNETNGNGLLDVSGNNDVLNWKDLNLIYLNHSYVSSMFGNDYGKVYNGFRYVRSAE